MARFTSKEQFLNKNVELVEDRLNSKYVSTTEAKPTFTTYFSINDEYTTVDSGTYDVEKLLGKNSPIRFTEIKSFPIYDINQMQINRVLEEQGITTDYEGEGLILPNTIIPKEHDYFIIDYFKVPCVFKINAVNHDTLKSNNYYRISFHITILGDDDYLVDLQRQTVKHATCNIENVNTNKQVIIEDDIYKKIEALDKVINAIKTQYRTLFFNEQLNSFMTTCPLDNSKRIYDRYLNRFIQESQIYVDPMTIDTIYLSYEDDDNTFDFEYMKSIYPVLLNKSPDKLRILSEFYVISSYDPNSIFGYYDIKTLLVRIMTKGKHAYIRQEFIKIMKDPHYIVDSESGEIDDVRVRLISNFLNNNYDNIELIDVDDWWSNFDLWFNMDFETYIFIPMVIYSMVRIKEDYLTRKTI